MSRYPPTARGESWTGCGTGPCGPWMTFRGSPPPFPAPLGSGSRRWRRPPSPFGVTRHNEDIRDYPLRRPVSTGIAYGQTFPGCVSQIEEREAAGYCHYTPLEFGGLRLGEGAACVAQYRLHWLVENHIQDAVAQAGERAGGDRREGMRMSGNFE